jgi:hypothetical protein
MPGWEERDHRGVVLEREQGMVSVGVRPRADGPVVVGSDEQASVTHEEECPGDHRGSQPGLGPIRPRGRVRSP